MTSGGHDEDDWCVIVADDDADWRELMVTMLQADGRRAVEASDGIELLGKCYRLLTTCRQLLVVSDIEMPGMTGIEVLGRLRSLAPRVNSMLITGSDSKDVLAQARSTGAVIVMRKPVSRKEFLEQVHRIICTQRSPRSGPTAFS